LERFRADVGSVLIATATFWQGVDVPGEALSLLVIDKLPFSAPGDPLHEARCEAVERAGGDLFRDYALPSAVLQLRQGFGRLIRGHGDRGVVAILDPRLRTRSYGRAFLAALPRCPLADDLAAVAASFRAGDRAASRLECRRAGVAERVDALGLNPRVLATGGFDSLPRHGPPRRASGPARPAAGGRRAARG